jgi:hypothetical protein
MSDAGKVVAIQISPVAGGPMQSVQNALAIVGAGLEGDRYCTGGGSYQKGVAGTRQVTLMNVRFFKNSKFGYQDSLRNIFVVNVDLMRLIGQEFDARTQVLLSLR